LHLHGHWFTIWTQPRLIHLKTKNIPKFHIFFSVTLQQEPAIDLVTGSLDVCLYLS
jgi:hypothetical protein